ncbi:MAG: enoyl-ACP reductase [Candidatus Melainabacteria bacterium]|nr:enoyl-ACP reductase [Candidatus Melainabacteria bacterium]
MQSNNLLKGKKGIIVGVANKWSIAWAVARACIREGAKVGFTYQGKRVLRNLEKLFEEENINNPFSVNLDVTKDEELFLASESIKKQFGQIDFFLHAVAFAKHEELSGEFVNISRDGYHLAQDVSSYSLIALSKAFKSCMEEKGGSIVTLSYLGSERVIKNYNVMGVAKAALESSARYLAYDLGSKNIRVNVVSPGPIKTLSASGIGDFSKMLEHFRGVAPLKKNVSAEEVADTCVFLFSDLSRAITGEIIYVDCGYNTVAM